MAAHSQVFIPWHIPSHLLSVHQQQSESLIGIDDFLGSGVCLLDFNRDGWLDVFHVTGSGIERNFDKPSWWSQQQGNKLFQNTGRLSHIKQQTFTSFIDASPLLNEASSYKGIGCAHADLNNDGYDEILVSSQDAIYLYINKQGVFEVKQLPRSGNKSLATSLLVNDVDQDGLLDFVVLNYIQFDKLQKTNEMLHGIAGAAHLLNITDYEPAANDIYLNKGDFNFDIANELFETRHAGRSLSGVWVDINQDQNPDLIISNDQGTANQVFLNQHAKLKPAHDLLAPLISQEGTHVIVPADTNRDGLLDFVTLSRAGQSYPTVLQQISHSQYKDVSWRYPLMGEKTLVHSFWSAHILDANLDGMTDMLLNAGLDRPQMVAPRLPQGQPNWLVQFDQLKGAATARVMDVAGVHFSGRGMAVGDVDNDGDQDILLSNNNGPLQFLLNQTDPAPAQWIGFVVINQHANSNAYGVRINVHTDTAITPTVVDFSNRYTYLSESSHRFHVGLPDKTGNDVSIEVLWPDGKKSQFKGLKPGRYYKLDYQGSVESLSDVPTHQALNVDQLSQQWHLKLMEWSFLGLFDGATSLPYLYHYYRLAETNQEAFVVWMNQLFLSRSLVNASQQFFSLLWAVLQTTDVDLHRLALDMLDTLEDEFALFSLFDYMQAADDHQFCQAMQLFKRGFREEELYIERKPFYLSILLKGISQVNAYQQNCLLEAITESEDYRILFVLDKYLAVADNVQAVKIAQALLRTHELSSSPSLGVPFHPTHELTRIKKIIAAQTLYHSKSEPIARVDKVSICDATVTASQPSVVSQSEKASRALICDNKHSDWLSGFEESELFTLFNQLLPRHWSAVLDYCASHCKPVFAGWLLNQLFSDLLSPHSRASVYPWLIQQYPHLGVIAYHRARKHSDKHIQAIALEYAYLLPRQHIDINQLRTVALGADPRIDRQALSAANTLMRLQDKKTTDYIQVLLKK